MDTREQNGPFVPQKFCDYWAKNMEGSGNAYCTRVAHEAIRLFLRDMESFTIAHRLKTGCDMDTARVYALNRLVRSLGLKYPGKDE